mmetsp:Transcript_7821/g.23532  ORF Transcript_7821/g.23532 Transcript_7821/m.23532 type:complete len:429 (+) Transcript_7821:219-1505(+)
MRTAKGFSRVRVKTTVFVLTLILRLAIISSSAEHASFMGTDCGVGASAETKHSDTGPLGGMEWRDDIDKVYSELKPPTRKRCGPQSQVSSCELLTKLSEEKIRSKLSEASRTEQSEQICYGIFLDLDKTCLFGNDGNDLGIAMQWMERPLNSVRELYRLLINPSLRGAFQGLLAHGASTKVAIYTMRASLLLYRSNFRGITIPLRYDDSWHLDGQLVLPPSVRDASEVMTAYNGPPLTSDEQGDLSHSLERLLVARDAVQDALGLDQPPSVVVSAAVKQVPRTAEVLGFPANTFLWDDNPRMAGQAGVLVVPPFVALGTRQRQCLAEFLERELPPSTLPEDLLDFMASANPTETVLSFRDGPSGLVPVWNLPAADGDQSPLWPLPQPLSQTASASSWGAGYLSPVTPDETAGVGDVCANNKPSMTLKG